MDLREADINALYEEYDRMSPRQEMEVTGGKFTYRYYKNPNPEIDATVVPLAGGTGLAEAFFVLTHEIGMKCSYLNFTYPQEFRDNDAMADAVAEMLTKVGAKNVYLLGQSYGGLLAQIIAVRHPEVVKGLILSSTASFSTDLKFEGMECIVRMISKEKEKKNLKIDRLLPKKLMAPAMKMVFRKHLSDEQMLGKVGEMMDLLKGEFTTEGFMLMDTLLGELRNHFGRYKKEDFAFLKGKVLIIEPDDDKIFTKDIQDALCHYFEDAEVVRSVEGGHLAMITNCDAYLEKVFAFLKRQAL